MISTEADEGATCSTMRMTSCMALAPPDQFADAAGLAQLARQRGHLLVVARPAQRAIEQSPQHGGLERLFDVPEGAGLDGRDGALFAAFSGDDDGGNVAQAPRRGGRAASVRPFPGSSTSAIRTAGRIFGESRQGFLGAGNAQHVQSPFAQQCFVALARVFLVLDDQDAFRVRFSSSAIRMSLSRLPIESTSTPPECQESNAGTPATRQFHRFR